jgi:aminopeptidase N
MKIELMNCTRVLLDEIDEKKITRDKLALTYAMAICSSDNTDWKQVNAAIIKRWSLSTLEYIKQKAWKMVEEKQAALENVRQGGI